MAKSSAHIEKGHDGYIAHNSREQYSHSRVFFDEENELWNDSKTAFEIMREEIKKRGAAYTERTKQKLQKNTLTHLSMVVNLERHHTLDDLQPIISHVEEVLDTKVFQTSIHRDEGKLVLKEDEDIKLVSGEDFFANPDDQKLYYDKEYTKPINMDEWEFEKNYHAHIESVGIDSEGNSIKRNRLNRYFLSSLQDFTAKTLGMERGEKRETYTREQMAEIREKLKPRGEYKSDRAYAVEFNKIAKELGYFIEKKPRRLDTHEFKAQAKASNDAVKKSKAKAKKKEDELKEEMKRLRRELQEAHARREHYAQIEALNKELQQQIADEKIKHFEAKQSLKKTAREIIDALKAENQNLKDENNELRRTANEEHQRTLDRINSTTRSLSTTTRTLSQAAAGDIRGATEARQAKRGAEEVDTGIERVAYQAQHVLDAVQGSVGEITHNAFKNRLEALESKNTTLTQAIEQKEAQIASYERMVIEKDAKITTLERELEKKPKEIEVITEVQVPAKVTFKQVKAFEFTLNEKDGGKRKTTVEGYFEELQGDRKKLREEIEAKDKEISEIKSIIRRMVKWVRDLFHVADLKMPMDKTPRVRYAQMEDVIAKAVIAKAAKEQKTELEKPNPQLDQWDHHKPIKKRKL